MELKRLSNLNLKIIMEEYFTNILENKDFFKYENKNRNKFVKVNFKRIMEENKEIGKFILTDYKKFTILIKKILKEKKKNLLNIKLKIRDFPKFDLEKKEKNLLNKIIKKKKPYLVNLQKCLILNKKNTECYIYMKKFKSNCDCLKDKIITKYYNLLDTIKNFSDIKTFSNFYKIFCKICKINFSEILDFTKYKKYEKLEIILLEGKKGNKSDILYLDDEWVDIFKEGQIINCFVLFDVIVKLSNEGDKFGGKVVPFYFGVEINLEKKKEKKIINLLMELCKEFKASNYFGGFLKKNEKENSFEEDKDKEFFEDYFFKFFGLFSFLSNKLKCFNFKLIIGLIIQLIAIIFDQLQIYKSTPSSKTKSKTNFFFNNNRNLIFFTENTNLFSSEIKSLFDFQSQNFYIISPFFSDVNKLILFLCKNQRKIIIIKNLNEWKQNLQNTITDYLQFKNIIYKGKKISLQLNLIFLISNYKKKNKNTKKNKSEYISMINLLNETIINSSIISFDLSLKNHSLIYNKEKFDKNLYEKIINDFILNIYYKKKHDDLNENSFKSKSCFSFFSGIHNHFEKVCFNNNKINIENFFLLNRSIVEKFLNKNKSVSIFSKTLIDKFEFILKIISCLFKIFNLNSQIDFGNSEICFTLLDFFLAVIIFEESNYINYGRDYCIFFEQINYFFIIFQKCLKNCQSEDLNEFNSLSFELFNKIIDRFQ